MGEGKYRGGAWQAEEAFAEDRPEFYDSWRAYREALALLKRYPTGRLPGGEGIDDFGAFLPSPAEVRRRIEQIRWLYRMGFDNEWIASIMQHESPPFALVFKAVRGGKTADEVRAQYRYFMEPNEYTKGDDDNGD